jgi:hypothetical protein
MTDYQSNERHLGNFGDHLIDENTLMDLLGPTTRQNDQVVMLLTCIYKMPDTDLRRDTNYTD